MIARVLIDTGPMVALFSARDRYHETCLAELREIAPPLLTSWPVLTEAAWLLRDDWNGLRSIVRSLENGLFALPEFSAAASPWIESFLHKYRDLGAQLADASLVYLAYRDDLDMVFTLDRRGFAVYRFGRNRSFNILP
ncbi:MAG: twitching motility protein PilT [Acidobacteria bacterium]|nr:twitching motility protein PilT [Acidobacteriota bacterium]MCI0621425.1 twitching motility protein PilT [Acidobacteriota bacterium]MCI0724443.1 twitching motility protein PilT [Acidobacteriota bacterium]